MGEMLLEPMPHSITNTLLSQVKLHSQCQLTKSHLYLLKVQQQLQFPSPARCMMVITTAITERPQQQLSVPVP
jgi:hypothetical protein